MISKLAIIFPEEPKSQNNAMTGISIEYYTDYCTRNKFTVSDNEPSVETLGSKIQNFLCLGNNSPFPRKAMLIFLFLRLHRTQCLHNIEFGGRGIRELTLDANK